MKLPRSLNRKSGSDGELKQHPRNKLDLFSLAEEDRIRVCKEIRDVLQQKILARKSEGVVAV